MGGPVSTFVPMTLRILSADGLAVILDCTEAAGYLVENVGPAGGRWRRRQAVADDVEGHQPIAEVLDSATVQVVVNVRAGTTAAVTTRAHSLRNAVWTAPQYRIEFGFDGVLEQWLCDRADVEISREWVDHHNWQRRVSITAPAQPRTV